MIQTPASRATDPATSYEAELFMNESGHRKTHQIMVQNMVEAKPGLTAAEIADEFQQMGFIHMDHVTVQRRLSDLNEIKIFKGDARKCVVKQRNMTTWFPMSLRESVKAKA